MRGALIAVLLISACGQKARVEYVPLPPLSPDAKSLVLAYSNDEFYGLSLDQGQQLLEMPLDRRLRSVTMEAALFSNSLSDLGLRDGAINSANDPSAPLPPDVGKFAIAIDDGVAAKRWTSLTSRGPQLASFRIPAQGCDSFSIKTFPLDTADAVIALVPLDNDSLLLVTQIGPAGSGQEAEFYEVRSDGPHKLPITIPDLSPSCQARSADGKIYLGGGSLSESYQIWVGGREGFSPIPLSPVGSYAEALAFSETSTGSDLALYMEGDSGSFERLDPAGWQTVVGATLATEAQKAALVWSGQGDEIFGLRAFNDGQPFLPSAELRHYHGGHLDRVSYPNQVLTAMARIPGLGILVGDINGQVWKLDPSDNLTTMGVSGRVLRVDSFVPYKDGFLFSGSQGTIHQWQPKDGFCTDTMPSGLLKVSLMMQLGDQIVVAGEPLANSTQNNFILLLSPGT